MQSAVSRSALGNFHYAPPLEPYLTAIHLDDELLVLSKPSGLLSVPGKAPEHRDSLETRAQERHDCALTVHRLDKDTSGIVVMARNKAAHRHLSIQFEKRHITKTYVAEIWGHPEARNGTVDLPLRCDWPNRPLQMIDHDLGKPSVTNWEVVAYSTNSTRVRLHPVTGRSHQLRVHMLSLGHPIVGDVFYADGEALNASDRMLLHAETLELYHPADGRRITFTDPCPF